jgi:hypothetical protein
MTTEQLAQEAGRIAAANPGLNFQYWISEIESLGSAQPTMLQRFGPTLAGGLALGAVTGAFNPVEQEAPPTPGYDKTTRRN